MNKILLIVILVLCTASCTDTGRAHLQAWSSSAEIKCYSGDKLIFDGKSTGKVQNAAHSDGYEFMDASDKRLTQVSGNCIVKY